MQNGLEIWKKPLARESSSFYGPRIIRNDYFVCSRNRELSDTRHVYDPRKGRRKRAWETSHRKVTAELILLREKKWNGSDFFFPRSAQKIPELYTRRKYARRKKYRKILEVLTLWPKTFRDFLIRLNFAKDSEFMVKFAIERNGGRFCWGRMSCTIINNVHGLKHCRMCVILQYVRELTGVRLGMDKNGSEKRERGGSSYHSERRPRVK